MDEGQIIVTGGSRGIGDAIMRELARRNLDVVCLSRSGTASVGRAFCCDMTDETALREIIAEVAAAGPIVGLVNSAGMHVQEPSATLSTDTYNDVMSLNATAVLVACRDVYPHLKAAGGGRIVNIGSFFDKLGVPGNLAYCASKAAVAAMTRCMAVEWARDGILVNNVAPGYIETDLNRAYLARDDVRQTINKRIPLGRPGMPDEVARVVAALFTENLSFLTGETIYVDGGQGVRN